MEDEFQRAIEEDVPRHGGEEQACRVLVFRVPEEERRHADDGEHHRARAEVGELDGSGGE